MKKVITLLALLFLVVNILFAQSDKTVITGKLIDPEGEPVTSASVAIYDSTETDIITGKASDESGEFEIELDPGSYVLKITYVSYGSVIQSFEVAGGDVLDLGEIEMKPTPQNLDEVVIRGERSQMEMDFDRRVFNVGRDITSLGGSAVNVLDNVPSISTDIEGNISLRGNESVRVLINGKPSSMVSSNVDALRSIPATMIKSVEIITNPSSKYAAEGSAGIINIQLVKDQNLGLNGSANGGIGYPEEYEGSVNLNYRTANVNWFTDIGVDFRSSPESGMAFERYAGPDADNPENTYMYREDTDATESEVDGDFRFGADIYLSDTEILTASAFINLERERNSEEIDIIDYVYERNAMAGSVDERLFRENNEEGNQSDIDFNLDYENKIEGDDHKLVADASFDISSEESQTDIVEEVQGTTGPSLRQESEDMEEEMDLRVNAEYVRPLFDDGKLEAGIRSDIEWMDNGYRARTFNPETGEWEDEPAYNDNFLYRENVNAAYVTVGGEFGNFSGQVGLRAENTRIRTEVKGAGDVSDQNYLNLFPTVFLNYEFNEQQSVQVSYSRRLRRPWSRMLLPIINIEDPRSQQVGNPNLTPEFSNSYEAGYLQYWETGSLLTSFYYRYRTDVIERITESQDGEGAQGTIRRPINLSTEQAWGVEFSADQEIIDNMTLTANANLFRSESEGTYQSQVFASESQNFSARSRLRWRIGGGWNYQASLRYRGPRETTQGRRGGSTMMDSGISRDLMDGKAKITFNVRDIFNSRNMDNTVTTDGNPNTDFYSHREFSWSTRSFTLNFQYFFGGGQQNQRGRSGGRRDY